MRERLHSHLKLLSLVVFCLQFSLSHALGQEHENAPIHPLPDLKEHVALLLSQREKFPKLIRGILTEESDTVEILKRQQKLLQQLSKNPHYQELAKKRSPLLDILITVSKEQGRVGDQRSSSLQGWINSLWELLEQNKFIHEKGAKQAAGKILREIRSLLLEKPYRAVVPEHFVAMLTEGLNEGKGISRKELFRGKGDGGINMPLLKQSLPEDPRDFGFKPKELGLLEGARKGEYLQALEDVVKSTERLDLLLSAYVMASEVEADQTLGEYLRRIKAGEIDFTINSTMQKRVVKELAHKDKLLEKSLRHRLKLLSKQIHRYGNRTKKGPPATTVNQLRLQEVPPELGIFRGCLGGDCSTSLGFAYPNDPLERIFFILNKRGEEVGYLQGMMGKLTTGEQVFFVNTIAGAKISEGMVEAIFLALLKAKEHLAVSDVVILGEQNYSSSLNYRAIRKAYEKYKGNIVKMAFDSQHQEVRTVIDGAVGSSYDYDRLKKLKQVHRIKRGDNTLNVEIDVSSGEGFPEGKSYSSMEKKGAFFLLIENPVLAEKLGISSSKQGNIKHHVVNGDELSIEDYEKNLQAALSRYSISFDEVLEVIRPYYLLGRLNARDAFTESIEQTVEIIEKHIKLVDLSKEIKDIFQKNYDLLIGNKSFLLSTKTSSIKDLLLFTAIEKDDLKGMDILIRHGADPNISNKYGDTSLHWAAEKGNLEAMKLLLGAGADLNIANNNGDTPLHWAAGNNKTEAMKLLLEIGANLNIANNNGDTPLLWAARHGNIEAIKLLAGAGADLNIANSDGDTPLLGAAKFGRLEAMKLLAGAGVNLNIANKYGDTPLLGAAKNGNLEAMKLLAGAGADLNIADNIGDTPLLWAAKFGRLEAMKLLAGAGANLNIANNIGDTPLLWAAGNNKTEAMKLLIEAGANPNITTNSNGNTPLHSTAKHGNTEAMKLLTGAGANLNIANKYGCTPLHWAAGNNKTEAMKLLLAIGADLNIANNNGDTPLHWAIVNGNTEAMKLLLAIGADLNIANNNGDTPLLWAAGNNNTAAMKLLIEARANPNITTNSNGNTPLHLTARHGNLEAMKLLAGAGADLNIANSDGDTPLQRAESNGDTKVVAFLKEITLKEISGCREILKS